MNNSNALTTAPPSTSAVSKNTKGKSKTKTKNADKPANRKKTFRLIIILVVLVLLIAAAAFVFLVAHFNLFALRDRFFEFTTSIDPNYQTVQQYEETLNVRNEEIKAREEAAAAEALRLEELETRLEQRETDIIAREKLLKAQRGMPIYRRPSDAMNDQEIADMRSLAAVYEEMNPVDAAAKILSKLNSTEDMAAVIYFMTPEAAAKVLAVMEPSVAADITNKLLRY